MPRSGSLSPLLLWLFVAWLAIVALGAAAACAEPASSWKIATERDKLTDQVTRFALTMPKSDPVQQGRAVSTALIIKCGGAFATGPTHAEVMILFDSLTGTWRTRTVETRFRFDDGPIRDYKLSIGGKGRAHAIVLPKFSDQDPVADLAAAKRLRVEVNLPHTGSTLLDFNVFGAADAVRAIACH